MKVFARNILWPLVGEDSWQLWAQKLLRTLRDADGPEDATNDVAMQVLVRREYTFPLVRGTDPILLSDSGSYIISNGPLTFPNTRASNGGWFRCMLEVGSADDDWTFNSMSADVSGAPFSLSGGELFHCFVKSATEIRLAGVGASVLFTEADFT